MVRTATLWGRDAERAEFARLTARARAGRSGVLVLRGEAGIGKSALLEQAARDAADLRVLRATGVEAEAGLPFAGLQMLLRPVLDRLDSLPGAQADALRGALGLAEVVGVDRFLVGLAVLTMLSDLAGERPLLCLIDDAHWLDAASAEALLFVARRIDAEGVTMLFAAREGFEAPALPELPLGALDRDVAAGLLAERVPDLTPAVRGRIVEESAGNPLALTELAAGLTAEQRAGRVDPPAVLPVAGRVLAAFGARIDRLPPRARLVLTIAAAEGTGDLGTVLQAARSLGASAGDLDATEEAGLVRIAGTTISFRHPLIRSAAYQRAAFTTRLTVHEALAGVVGGERRVWHMAAAAAAPDESVAAELEHVAESARGRGAAAAAVPVYEQAARLSPGRAERARRMTLAAQSAITAGRTEQAAALAGRAAALTEDPSLRAGLAMVRATVESERGAPGGAARLLIENAVPVAGDDPELALVLLVIAAGSAWSAGEDAEVREVARLAGGLDLGGGADASTVAAIAGLGRLIDGDYARALPVLDAFVTEIRSRPPGGLIVRIFAGNVALLLGDDEAALELSAADVARGRRLGQAGALPGVLQIQAQAQVVAGLHHDAAAAVAEALTLARDTGQSHRVGRLGAVAARIAAVHGDEDRCRELARGAAAGLPREGAAVRDEGAVGFGRIAEAAAYAECALGLLDLTLGRYEQAARRLEEIVRGPARHTAAALFAVTDLVEAAVRAGAPERARQPFARFAAWARAADRPWADAVVLRCRALLSPAGEAGELYAEAVRLHGRGGRPFERARTELLYGEWLRRSRRRSDARTPLRSALEIFERLGAVPWAERVRAELRASGDAVPGEAAGQDALGRLTPQESQVVRLAAEGVSNRDIAARLFLSHRTVEYHLYKAYPKLGIGSRAELARFRW
ncbi:transcriptional regulator [Microtetraspora sp. NBRC 13810]|uniref:helix-turn-helix transcriptional regulator n=1 Tax=Microtetraspora sp. NBRC 13810 TaxID=3030990 RepID=UPI0024A49F68|nr:LuxR family transcriptional regulator [Microtetraspora sp. NBRC 13810]GLW10441.1 transcriptional regulator [Microtetraspora sp. NBRC 13810]